MADHPIAIRRMLAADLDAVVRLENAAHQTPWSEDLIRRELDHDWSTVLLAWDESGKLVGHVIFWIVLDEIHILNVATDPAFRRRGYARALMIAAEQQGAPKAALSTLEVRRSNEAAIGLYRGLGYEQVGVRPKYYADNDEDAILMTKNLRG